MQQRLLICIALIAPPMLVGCESARVQPSAVTFELTQRVTFPGTPLGQSSRRAAQLKNVSRHSIDLMITSVGPFRSVTDRVTLESGEERRLEFIFTPATLGPAEGHAQVVAGAESALVAFDGDAIAFPCASVADSCSEVSYDVETGSCVERALPDGTPCADACRENPVCLQGRCAGLPKVCDDGNACTADTCEPATGCRSVDRSADCPAAPDSCHASSCSPDAGCVIAPVEDGTACGQSACLAGLQCSSGSCLPQTLAGPFVCEKPVHLISGPNAFCGITATKAVRCWGLVPTLGVRPSPAEFPLPAFEDLSFVGLDSVCVRDAARAVKCWGSDSELGFTGSPQQLPGLTDVVQVQGGWRFACALIADGGTLCWGDNSYGQLGDGTKVSRVLPQPVIGLEGAERLQEMGHTACVTHVDGGLSCWGLNSSGEVGDGTTDDRLVPVAVSMPAKVIAVGMRAGTHSAVLADGSAWAWGHNYFGNVGSGPINQLTPFNVGLADVVQIKSNLLATCAVDSAGDVWCWGTNWEGQVAGAPPRTEVWPPQKVVGLSNVVQLVASTSTFCALVADGRPFCWGRNVIGEVGDGTLMNRFVPTPVLW